MSGRKWVSVGNVMWVGAAVSLCVILSGCSGQEGKEGLVPAYGTVTLDGEPLVDAQVTFDHPQFPETYGRTDKNGYYEMSYTMAQEGAFVGENVVSFMTASEASGREERLPERYLFGKSDIRINVTEGGAPYDFALESSPEPSSGTTD